MANEIQRATASVTAAACQPRCHRSQDPLRATLCRAPLSGGSAAEVAQATVCLNSSLQGTIAPLEPEVYAVKSDLVPTLFHHRPRVTEPLGTQ